MNWKSGKKFDFAIRKQMLFFHQEANMIDLVGPPPYNEKCERCLTLELAWSFICPGHHKKYDFPIRKQMLFFRSGSKYDWFGKSPNIQSEMWALVNFGVDMEFHMFRTLKKILYTIMRKMLFFNEEANMIWVLQIG